jgi:hypothetical protein
VANKTNAKQGLLRLISTFTLAFPILASANNGLIQPNVKSASTYHESQPRLSSPPWIGNNGIYLTPEIIAKERAADSTSTTGTTSSSEPVRITIGPASLALEPGKSATFAASVTGTGNSAVTWSLYPALGTVTNGVYTAPAIVGSPQNVVLTAASVVDSTKVATATITLTPSVMPEDVTPHFGNDGSVLTSYVPGKSMFVRSVFFSLVTNLSEYVNAFHNAQINTLESGFYVPPNNGGNNYTSAAKWQSDFDGHVKDSIVAAADQGFNIILTGDAIARGSNAVYDDVSGPSTAWNPDPITYAFTWAKNFGKVIGVEMVDEISSQFTVPFPQGQLGQPGGPQKISCVDNLCTVSWPSQPVIENGDGTFLITGATSNANLNRTVANQYHQNASFVLSSNPDRDGFTFNATGIGTQTFTAATDPELTLQMFASGPEGPSGTDYVHNDAISRIMSYVNAVPGRPSVTWPAAALVPPANFGAWAAPGASDYNDIYFTFYSNSNPTSYTLKDGLLAFNNAWSTKYPFAQKDKPTLMLVSDVGVGYDIAGTSIPVATFDGNTLTLSQPHGIVTPTVGLTRLSISGDSNSSLNGNYYVYNVVNANTVQVYPATTTGPSIPQGITVTFSDGQVLNVTGGWSGSLSATGILFNGAAYCVNVDNFGKVATVLSSTYAAYTGEWYVMPLSLQNNGNNGNNPCSFTLDMILLTRGQAGAGGSASLITDNYYHPGVSKVTVPSVTPDLVAANIMFAAEKGAAGVRVYMFGGDSNQNQALDECFTGCSNQDNANPLYNGADAQARWKGMSNAFNLIQEIEPYLLQPKLSSPYYGPTITTGARTSRYGTLLMLTEFADSSEVVNIDLKLYNPSGGNGTMYRMTGEELTQQSVSGTSVQVTLASGETVAFTFPPADQKNAPAAAPLGSHGVR